MLQSYPTCCCRYRPAYGHPCYRQVPVTAARPCEQTVMKPICRTEYIEQPVTVCKPVCANSQFAEVPECTYHPVTEFYPQTRDMGGYQTFCHCCPRMSPARRFQPRPLRLAEQDQPRDADGLHAAIHVSALGRRVCYHAGHANPPGRRPGVRRVTYNVTRMQTEIKAPPRGDQPGRHGAEGSPASVDRHDADVLGTTVAWIPAGSLAGNSSTATALNPSPIRSASGPGATPRRGTMRREEDLQEGIHEQIEKDFRRREEDRR